MPDHGAFGYRALQVSGPSFLVSNGTTSNTRPGRMASRSCSWEWRHVGDGPNDTPPIHGYRDELVHWPLQVVWQEPEQLSLQIPVQVPAQPLAQLPPQSPPHCAVQPPLQVPWHSPEHMLLQLALTGIGATSASPSMAKAGMTLPPDARTSRRCSLVVADSFLRIFFLLKG